MKGVTKDESGNESDTSANAPFAEYKIDHTPPNKPMNLKVIPSMGYITLEWVQGLEVDLVAYRIYKAVNEAGPYTLAEDNLTSIQYRDRDVNKDVVYYYKVTAIDIAGNESEQSDVVFSKMLPDNEVPRVISINPAINTILPSNPKISVLAADNYKLASVALE